MARIEWVDARLWNWARWKHGARSGGLGYATLDMSSVLSDRNPEARIPINDDEASTTEVALKTLVREVQQVVEEYYLRPGPVDTIARELGIGTSTLHARMDRAHRGIAGWIGERERQAMAERRRVEGLGRACAA
jgi:DNA-directed RNA polymerase specialized sigma24 family protein